MSGSSYRQAIQSYIREQARPPDKFSHQVRLYALGSELARGQSHDDDVLHAAAWMHDLGVFIGHRPEDPAALARWDCVRYAMIESPALLRGFGFPEAKIPAVIEAIRTHQPAMEPTTFEGVVLRDADILEQLGVAAILRTVSKVGRDTRFVVFGDALRVLQRNATELPGKLRLEAAQRLAGPRIDALRSFLAAAEAEAEASAW